MIVRKLRLQRGWSQSQLAEMLGVATRTGQRLEQGQRPSLETAKALAAGSDYLVIGRPISQAADPAQALADIVAELG